MPSKNSLQAVQPAKPAKVERKPVLPQVPGDQPGSTSAKPRKKRMGRPPLDKAAKRDYKVTLSFTGEQGRAIQAKAGLASEATVLYDHLLKTGFFD